MQFYIIINSVNNQFFHKYNTPPCYLPNFRDERNHLLVISSVFGLLTVRAGVRSINTAEGWKRLCISSIVPALLKEGQHKLLLKLFLIGEVRKSRVQDHPVQRVVVFYFLV